MQEMIMKVTNNVKYHFKIPKKENITIVER